MPEHNHKYPGFQIPILLTADSAAFTIYDLLALDSQYSLVLVLVQFSELLCLFSGRVEDSIVGKKIHPLNGTEHGSLPYLTTRDRELVSVLEVRIEPGDLHPRPLTPDQSVTLLTLSRTEFAVFSRVNSHIITFFLW